MKTQILHLEPHDDATSVRDKMGWNQAGRLLLIWPDRGQPLNRRLDLVLVLRHSARIGAQLALVTRDPRVRSHASDLGIPVFKNPRQAQKRSWHIGRRRRWQYRPLILKDEERPRPDFERLRQDAHPPIPAWLDRPELKVALFALGVLAVLSIAALLVPSAEIRFSPRTQLQEISMNVLVNPNPGLEGLENALSARTQLVTVEGVLEKPSSGSTKVPTNFAEGSVTFTNLTGDPVRIPAGSIVSTLPSAEDEPVRYEVTRGGTVAGGPGSSLTLPVRAVLPGPDGNQPAGLLVGIEGDLGLRLSANNPRPISGGTSITAPAPDQEDYEELKSALETDLASKALKEVQARLSSADWLLSEEAIRMQVIEQEYEPANPQASDRLKLRMWIEFEFLIVLETDLRNLAGVALEEDLPEGFVPVPASIKMEILSKESVVEGTNPGSDPEEAYRVTLKASRQIQALISPLAAARSVLGLPPDEAEAHLASSLPLAFPPEVAIKPAGWPRLPVLPFRIQVIEQLEGATGN